MASGWGYALRSAWRPLCVSCAVPLEEVASRADGDIALVRHLLSAGVQTEVFAATMLLPGALRGLSALAEGRADVLPPEIMPSIPQACGLWSGRVTGAGLPTWRADVKSYHLHLDAGFEA